MAKISGSERKSLTDGIFGVVMNHYIPDLGLDYMNLKPALRKFIHRWSKKNE